jgi:cytochrome c oxidase assembly protein subunit 11
MSMVPYLLLKQSAAPSRLSRQRRHFSSSISLPRSVVRIHQQQRISDYACRRRLVPTTFRRNSSTSHSQHQRHQHAEKEAQKSAYAYYQRQKQDGLWSKFRSIWPRSNKRTTKNSGGGSTSSSASSNSGSTSQQQRNVNTAWYSAAVVVGALGATYAAVPLYKVFCQTTGFGGTTQRVRIIPGSAAAAAAGESNNDVASVGSQLVSLVDSLFSSVTEAFQPSSSSGGSLSKSRARVHTWTDEEAAARLASLKPVANADLMTIRFDTTVGDVMPWSFVPVQLDVKVVPGETALSFFRVTNHSDKGITGVATYNVHPAKVGLYFQKIQCFCFEEQRLLPGETVDMPVFFFIDPEILKDPQVSYVRSITLSYTFFQTDSDDVDDDDEDDNDNKTKPSK